jgi:hypothetical protein
MDIEKKMEDYQKEINNLKIEAEKKEHMHDPYIKDLESKNEGLIRSNLSLKNYLKYACIAAAALFGIAVIGGIGIVKYNNAKKAELMQRIEQENVEYAEQWKEILSAIKKNQHEKISMYIADVSNDIKNQLKKSTDSYENK